MSPVEVLNPLLVLHSHSLPMYLASATPHHGRDDDRALEALELICADQRLMVDRIAAVIHEQGGTVRAGEFPMEFTDLHDLSLEFVLRQVVRRQKAEIAEIEHLAGKLDSHARARAVAREALGAAKAHLHSLEECLASAPSGV